MILVITHRSDFTADFLIDRMNKKGTLYRRLNCEDLLEDPLIVSFEPEFTIRLLGESHFDAVWFRRTKWPDFPGLSPDQRHYLVGETEALLKGLFTVINARWISDPFAVYRAEYKLLQLKTAASIGFNIPKTLITNSREELNAFYQACKQQVVIKPLAQTRLPGNEGSGFIFTNKLPLAIFSKLNDFELTPCIYQEDIPKAHEIRVTVVGEQVFAAQVDSQSDPATRTDWRKKDIPFQSTFLPVSVSQNCIALVRALGLSFGAIDLIKKPSGEYIFLEINPNGQWAWIELQTGLPIADAILNLLSS